MINRNIMKPFIVFLPIDWHLINQKDRFGNKAYMFYKADSSVLAVEWINDSPDEIRYIILRSPLAKW